MMETFIGQTMLSDLSICDGLIEYHKNNTEFKSRGKTLTKSKDAKVSTDVRVFLSSNNLVVGSFLKEILNSAKIYLEKYTPPNMLYLTIREAFQIQHYAPNEGFFSWHCERSCYQSDQRALVFMTYLNDVTDGGETEFYWQGVKIRPMKGKTVIWPTDFTHLHRGITSPTQEKYIATGWLHYPDAIDYMNKK